MRNLGGRQATKSDLLEIAGDLGIAFGCHPTVDEVRQAIQSSLATIHTDLGTLFPELAENDDKFHCQKRIVALHTMAEKASLLIPKHKLVHIAQAALRVAADQYDQDAQSSSGCPRLVDQFTQQAADARELANQLELETIVLVKKHDS